MDMDFVNKFVQIILMTCAEIDESLHGLVRIGGKILALCGFDDGDCIGDKVGEIGDAIVNVCGFVDADEGLVEDLEEVTEELQRGWLQREFPCVSVLPIIVTILWCQIPLL
jgi:hypothetical protein